MGKTIVAAFDFDGTLTYKDTLIPFLLFACGPLKLMKEVAVMTPMFLGYLLKFYDRQQVKETLLKRTIGGMPMVKVKEIGVQFARMKMPDLLRPEGMQRLGWHLKEGHRTVLVSANLNVYLEPWAKDSGFHDLICSQVAEDEKQRVTGRLVGKNCRAHEKVVRLKQLLVERDLYEVYAYGDSAGDKEMLAWSDFPFYKKFE